MKVKNGLYTGKLSLIDSTGQTNDFELEFEVACESSDANGLSFGDSGFEGVVIGKEKVNIEPPIPNGF